MNTILIALAAVAFAGVVALALRGLWRAFIRVTDREINAEYERLRQRGFFREEERSR